MWLELVGKIIFYIIIEVLALFGIYWLSRLQMIAWIHELDLHFGKKFTEFINNKKEKDDKVQR
jgi:hypothetical protein